MVDIERIEGRLRDAQTERWWFQEQDDGWVVHLKEVRGPVTEIVSDGVVKFLANATDDMDGLLAECKRLRQVIMEAVDLAKAAGLENIAEHIEKGLTP